MVETNVRVVHPGMALRVPVRLARVTSTHTDPDLLEKVCTQLRRQHHIAAVSMPNDKSSILIATGHTVPALRFEEEPDARSQQFGCCIWRSRIYSFPGASNPRAGP
jgi:hypothetical protein